MQNKPKSRIRQNRRALNLLFSGVTFLILLSVGLIMGVIVIILINTGVIDLLLNGLFNQTILVFLILGTFFIIGAALTLIISKYLMHPMNKIINATNELAEGNYKVRLSFSGLFGKHPTIAEFTDAFNEMAEELDHTEIMSTDFVNNFSHEIKTPVASIAGFAKLLQNKDLSDEKRTEYAGIIEEESKRLSQVAANTLTLAKIENQKKLEDITHYNLSEQIRNILLLLEKKWSEKNLDLHLRFTEVFINANKDLLNEVWLNLLDNAIKFSNQNGELRVVIDDIDGIITVKISNTGSYIPKSERKRIFNKFYQIDQSHSSEGNGIGLAIVKEIVELHHGTISADSIENTTVFTVVLPAK